LGSADTYDRVAMVFGGPLTGVLLERQGELEALGRLMRDARSARGCLVSVEGPAGIGKSSLLDACAQEAVGLGMGCLRVRGDEVAMESSFAAVRELFWREVGADGPGVLPGAAALAGPVFEGEVGVGADRDRVGAVLHGLYWLVADLAERAPLALLIDDAQWVDVASARFLVYLARRIDSLSVLLAVVVRDGEAPGAVAGLSGRASVVLRPEPLSEVASGEVVRGALGARADEELCRSCHEATGGNPFYLRELLAALRADPSRPSLEAARRVRTLGAGAIGRSVLVRLARLGDDCERLAEALAVLAPGSPLRHAATVARLDRRRGVLAADRLRAADLLAATPALGFTHPIVREAIAAQLPASRRAALHAEAAALLAAEGAPADRVAAHLLFAEPYGEGWVVDALRAGARQALARGAPEAAVSYLRRALAEPPAPRARLDVFLELGRAEALLPIAQDFPALSEALELTDDPNQRAEIAHDLAMAHAGVGHNAAAWRVLKRVLDRADTRDAPHRLWLEAHLIGGAAPCLGSADMVRASIARYFGPATRGEIRDPIMLTALAQTAAVTGRPADECAGLARRALAEDRLLDVGVVYLAATGALAWTDRLDEAARAQELGIAEAQRRGSAPMFMHGSVYRAITAFRAGDLDVAEDHAQRAYELARELGTELFVANFLIPVLLERDRVPDAFELIDSLGLTEAELDLWQGVSVLAGRGQVRVALGHLEQGVVDLVEAGRRMTDAGYQLSVLVDWVPSAVTALVRLGRDREARRLAEQELAEAAGFGAPRRYGIAMSVCGKLDRGSQGMDRLLQAVRILERGPARLAYAHALVNFGEGLRERGRRQEAREPLARGLDLAHRERAIALAQRARLELRACGARPRRMALSGAESLTPAELRTARMAADGQSNRQIAQALFVTTKTVEAQLSQAYNKLGIHSRAQLANALAGSGPPTSDREPAGKL
jgi:DNA-binding CsgD family transcriptional regulator